MSTTIRPELSEKNPYWIEKHRYYELKHFCLQYPIWKKARAALSGLSQRPMDAVILARSYGDPTAKCVEAREFYSERMELIEKAAAETDAELGDYILQQLHKGFPMTISEPGQMCLAVRMFTTNCTDVSSGF